MFLCLLLNSFPIDGTIVPTAPGEVQNMWRGVCEQRVGGESAKRLLMDGLAKMRF